MKSTPIIPGKLYQVTGCGLDLPVIARSPFAAIIAVVAGLK